MSEGHHRRDSQSPDLPDVVAGLIALNPDQIESRALAELELADALEQFGRRRRLEAGGEETELRPEAAGGLEALEAEMTRLEEEKLAQRQEQEDSREQRAAEPDAAPGAPGWPANLAQRVAALQIELLQAQDRLDEYGVAQEEHRNLKRQLHMLESRAQKAFRLASELARERTQRLRLERENGILAAEAARLAVVEQVLAEERARREAAEARLFREQRPASAQRPRDEAGPQLPGAPAEGRSGAGGANRLVGGASG